MKSKIVTLSQFGSRVSIAQLHIKKLFESFCDKNVFHIFYLVDPNQKELANFLRFIEKDNKNVKLYSKEDNNITDFNRKDIGFGGGDTNYEFLIRCPEVDELFLTLHDDSMVFSKKIFEVIEKLSKKYDFGGYLDTRKIDSYDKIFLDEKPISELRIGTWFLFGKKSIFLKNKYTTGLYKTLSKEDVDKQFHHHGRLELKNCHEVWLNGGFNLNIQARLDRVPMKILDDYIKNLAEHITKVTGFFAPRGMLRYADQSNEVEIWQERILNLRKEKSQELYRDPDLDISFLKKLSNMLEKERIFDPLLNRDTIAKLSTIK